jgi:spore germination protein KA
LSGILKKIADLLTFKEPEKAEKFILKETGREEAQQEEESKKSSKGREGHTYKIIGPKSDKKTEDQEKGKTSDISKKLSENMDHIKEKFSIPTNGDVVLREFDIVVKDKVIPAFMVFIDGMTDRKVINDDILQPLMLLSNLDIRSNENGIAEYIRSHILPHNQIKEVREHQAIIDEVNFGGCGIYIDGIDSAFAADVKGWAQRGIEKPNTELVLRGPQEGFNESLRSNTSLIRKRVKDEKLVVESIRIGKRSKTPCSMLYIKDIANDSLVKEVRRRLKSIKIDHILDTGNWNNLLR